MGKMDTGVGEGNGVGRGKQTGMGEMETGMGEGSGVGRGKLGWRNRELGWSSRTWEKGDGNWDGGCSKPRLQLAWEGIPVPLGCWDGIRCSQSRIPVLSGRGAVGSGSFGIPRDSAQQGAAFLGIKIRTVPSSRSSSAFSRLPGTRQLPQQLVLDPAAPGLARDGAGKMEQPGSHSILGITSKQSLSHSIPGIASQPSHEHPGNHIPAVSDSQNPWNHIPTIL